MHDIDFSLYNSLLGSFDCLIKEISKENKELKNGFEMFEKKIKQYEKDHIEQLKKNEDIIEDLKTENNILK